MIPLGNMAEMLLKFSSSISSSSSSSSSSFVGDGRGDDNSRLLGTELGKQQQQRGVTS